MLVRGAGHSCPQRESHLSTVLHTRDVLQKRDTGLDLQQVLRPSCFHTASMSGWSFSIERALLYAVAFAHAHRGIWPLPCL